MPVGGMVKERIYKGEKILSIFLLSHYFWHKGTAKALPSRKLRSGHLGPL